MRQDPKQFNGAIIEVSLRRIGQLDQAVTGVLAQIDVARKYSTLTSGNVSPVMKAYTSLVARVIQKRMRKPQSDAGQFTNAAIMSYLGRDLSGAHIEKIDAYNRARGNTEVTTEAEARKTFSALLAREVEELRAHAGGDAARHSLEFAFGGADGVSIIADSTKNANGMDLHAKYPVPGAIAEPTREVQSAKVAELAKLDA